MENRKITTSIYSFEDIRKSNLLYIDKTEYFYNLITGGDTCFFCSRPRRFGKSLALSIFHAIFTGRKDLFEGLYIYNQDYDWQTYPVIHIDMARCACNSAEHLHNSIMSKLAEIAEEYEVQLNEKTPGDYFDALISALKKKTGKGVVILIDEYDHPLNENIDNPGELEGIRRELNEFYKIIKGQNANERFVFMTGVTKFNKVSIFSKLNNLQDITFSRDYACIFGYTQEELEKNFARCIDEHIAEEAAAGNTVDKTQLIAEIKKWYNGFKFDYKSETVYNPVSVGNFFINHCRFSNYWFTTGTPTLLVNLARKQRLEREDIETALVSDISLSTFQIADFATGNVSKEKLILLLLQTGYVTINEKMGFYDGAFSVRFPNYEVENSFANVLFSAYSGVGDATADSYVLKIKQAAYNGNTSDMIEHFKNFLSEVPYTIQIPEEKYYQTVIFCILRMCGMEIQAERATSTGRIDAVFEMPKHIYILEFKVNKDASAAANQIENKKYFQPFIESARNKDQEIHCLGINFCTDKEVRNINDWKEIQKQ